METPARSLLFLPASNPRAVEKAQGLAVDIVALDLEDAVGPDDKAQARRAAVQAVREGGFRAPRVLVRINGLDTAWGAEDLAALSDVAVDGLIVPKVSSSADLSAVAGACPRALWAMIETPAALFQLRHIADAPGVEGLLLGLNDLGAALRCRTTPDRLAFHTAMGLTVAAARAAGVTAIDAVFNAIDDPEGFEAECRQGRTFGFDGKALIHPSQIEAAHRAFSPDAADVAWAQAVVAAYADPANAGRGAIKVMGRQTERLHLDEAKRLLTLHGICNSP